MQQCNIVVLNQAYEDIALAFVEYMSIENRPYANEPEYVQFCRWLKRECPGAVPLAASIWAWELVG